MPTIPFPNVPSYPGVPPLPRSGNIPPAVSFTFGVLQQLIFDAIQSGVQWGIYDSNGNELGLVATSSQAGSLIVGIISGPILSTNAFEFAKEMRISDFPVEKGGFANYNKVELPANPVVTLALSGSSNDRTSFLNLIDAACKSTALYNVVTPEITYYNYSIERYTYVRRQDRGASLLMVEISLKEIRQVSAAYSTVQTPINKPQNPAAVPQSSSGMTNPQTPPVSTLKSIWNLLPGLAGMS